MTYWKDPDLISFQTIECSGLACTLSQKNGFSFVLGASSSSDGFAGPEDDRGAFGPRLIGGGGPGGRGPFRPGGGGGLGPPEPGGGAGGGGLGGPAEDGIGGAGAGGAEDFFEDTLRNLGGSIGRGSTLPEGGLPESLETVLPGGGFNGGIP